MSLDCLSDSAETLGRDYLDLVHDHDTPIMMPNEVHHLCRKFAWVSLPRIAQHGVGADQHHALAVELLFCLVSVQECIMLFLDDSAHRFRCKYQYLRLEVPPSNLLRYLTAIINSKL